MPPMTGRVIAGRYSLRSPIGRGAMGVVWRAHDQLLDREVAVKEVVISDLIGADERRHAYQRTLREARTAGRLSHRGVVAVYDVAEEDGRPWIIMELVPSSSLDQVLAVEGRLSPLRAGRIGQQLLAALAHAHACGVLHRDVKPSNVLIARERTGGPEGWDQRAVLTDFGIAQFEGDPRLTQTGMVMGSPGFTAPERIRGGEATPASDLWSLGATIYTAVEGRGPYEQRGGAITTMSAIIHEDAPIAPHAGRLGPLIAALLRRNPAERPTALAAMRMFAQVLPLLVEKAAASAPSHPATVAVPSAPPPANAAVSAQARGSSPAGHPDTVLSAASAKLSPAGPDADEPAAVSAASGAPDTPDTPGSPEVPGSPAKTGETSETVEEARARDGDDTDAEHTAAVPGTGEPASATESSDVRETEEAGDSGDAADSGGTGLTGDTNDAGTAGAESADAADSTAAAGGVDVPGGMGGVDVSDSMGVSGGVDVSDSMGVSGGADVTDSADAMDGADGTEAADGQDQVAPAAAAAGASAPGLVAASPVAASVGAAGAGAAGGHAGKPMARVSAGDVAVTTAEPIISAEPAPAREAQTRTDLPPAGYQPTELSTPVAAQPRPTFTASRPGERATPTFSAASSAQHGPRAETTTPFASSSAQYAGPSQPYADLSAQYPPGAGGGHMRRRGRTAQWLIMVVIAVLLAAGIGAGLAYALHGHAAAAAPDPATSTATATAFQSVNALNKPVSAVPAGWNPVTVTLSQTGPAAGFSIGLPPGWTEHRDGFATDFLGPGGLFLDIDLTPHAHPDMVIEARHIEEHALAGHRFPRYRRLHLGPVPVRGTTGAIWQFTWTPAGSPALLADDILFIKPTPAGSQSYAIYIRGQRAGWAARDLPVFDKILRTFQTVPAS